MASTWSNAELRLMTTGENDNTWGDQTNYNLQRLDELKDMTFISLTNKVYGNPSNVISAGVNATSQLNTIKKFVELNKLNKTPFISMVNLIANRKIVTEFVQSGVKVKNIVREITPLLSNTKKRKDMLLGFDEVRRSLGLPGVYKRAAESIMKKTNSG